MWQRLDFLRQPDISETEKNTKRAKIFKKFSPSYIKEKIDYYKNRELNFVEKIVPEHIFGLDVGWDSQS